MGRHHWSKFVIAATSALVLTAVGCSSDPMSDEGAQVGQSQQGLVLQARSVLAKRQAPRRPAFKHRLIVKFADSLTMRADAGGGLSSQALSASSASVAAAKQLAGTYGMHFSQLIRLPASRLAGLEARAATASGVAQPDLAGILIVDVAEQQMQAAAVALHASPLTEFVYFQELTPPPPQASEDIPPVTPDYMPFQTYHGPNPGLNMTQAWALGDTRGAGVRIANVEYGYAATHEDLCDIIPEPGQTIHPTVFAKGWEQHGTAVFGELVSGDNGYGATGLVPDATAYFFPEWTVEEEGRRVTAIANAIATMDPGDVVLLEMQASAPGGDCSQQEADCVPAEIDPAVWTVTKAGTDAGVIVVAAAGNGNHDLDGPLFEEYSSRGDSGAIVVGAGSPNTNHDRLLGSFGSRVNVQGWGSSVFTLGYGYFSEIGGDPNQRYSSSFSGTSSASPFVAAAAVALQSYAESEFNQRLTPSEMRDLLVATGVPQGAGGHIGPFPDVVAAINALSSVCGDEVCDATEDCASCPNDCGVCSVCGDEVCNGTEDCASCPDDCGPCPGCVPVGCAGAPSVSLPYAVDGMHDSCVFFTGPGSNLNSWNMSVVEINGVDVSNQWVASSSYPLTCDGGYYLRSIGGVPWSHVEAM